MGQHTGSQVGKLEKPDGILSKRHIYVSFCIDDRDNVVKLMNDLNRERLCLLSWHA